MSFAQQLKGMKKKKKAKGIEKEPSQSLESLQERDATSRSVEEDVQELLRFEGPRLMIDVAAKESAMASDEADAVAEALAKVLPAKNASISPATTNSHYPQCIALLFLVRSDLPHERVWRKWIAWARTCGLYVRVYVHSHKPPKNYAAPAGHQSEGRRGDIDGNNDGKGGSNRCSRWSWRRISGYDTKWGSLDLVKAAVALVEEALNDRPLVVNLGSLPPPPSSSSPSFDESEASNISVRIVPQRFLFASESCIPVVSPARAKDLLFGPPSYYHRIIESHSNTGNCFGELNRKRVESGSCGGGSDDNKCKPGKETHLPSRLQPNVFAKSWMAVRNRANNGYAKQYQFDCVSLKIPPHCRWKADQWVCLTRAHAAAVISIQKRIGVDLVQCLASRNMKASDELFFPMALSILGLIPQLEESTDLAALSLGPFYAGAATALNDNTAATAATAIPKTSSTDNGVNVDEHIDRSVEESSTLEQQTKGLDMLVSNWAIPSAHPHHQHIATGEQALACEVLARRLTYADWHSEAHNSKSPANIMLEERQFDAARAEGCLFARKFSRNANAARSSGQSNGEDFYDRWKSLITSAETKDRAASTCRRDAASLQPFSSSSQRMGSSCEKEHWSYEDVTCSVALDSISSDGEDDEDAEMHSNLSRPRDDYQWSQNRDIMKDHVMDRDVCSREYNDRRRHFNGSNEISGRYYGYGSGRGDSSERFDRRKRSRSRSRSRSRVRD